MADFCCREGVSNRGSGLLTLAVCRCCTQDNASEIHPGLQLRSLKSKIRQHRQNTFGKLMTCKRGGSNNLKTMGLYAGESQHLPLDMVDYLLFSNIVQPFLEQGNRFGFISHVLFQL